MKKREVTDEMVERALEQSSKRINDFITPECRMRAVLFAALNPTVVCEHDFCRWHRPTVDSAWMRACRKCQHPEYLPPEFSFEPSHPEIHVSPGMTQAGLWAFHHEDELPNPEPWRSPLRHDEMARAYRAMEAKRREEMDERKHSQTQQTGHPLRRKNFGRRKDDAK